MEYYTLSFVALDMECSKSVITTNQINTLVNVQLSQNNIRSSKVLTYSHGPSCSTLKMLLINPIAIRKAKIAYNFGLSECNRVNEIYYEKLHFQTY